MSKACRFCPPVSLLKGQMSVQQRPTSEVPNSLQRKHPWSLHSNSLCISCRILKNITFETWLSLPDPYVPTKNVSFLQDFVQLRHANPVSGHPAPKMWAKNTKENYRSGFGFRVSGRFVFCWFWLANWFQKTSYSIFCWQAFRWFVTISLRPYSTKLSCQRLFNVFGRRISLPLGDRPGHAKHFHRSSGIFHSKYFDLAKCHDASATHCKKVFGNQEITALSFKAKES